MKRLTASPSSRVWLLDAVLVAGALLLFSEVSRLPAMTHQIRLSAWILTLLFALAEVFVIHVRFRRNTHTFSLNEIPLVLGLFFSSPGELLFAAVLGPAGALLVHRRQAPMKLVFNLSQLALTTGSAAVVFQALRPDDVRSPLAWVAAFAAVSFASLISVALTTLAIRLAEGSADLAKRLEVLAVGLGSAVSTTCLALIAVRLAAADPRAMLLLGTPLAALFVAYRAYLGDRQRHEEIGHLYEVSRTFQEAADVDDSIRALLRQATDMFRAERAEVILLSPEEGGTPLRSVLGGPEAIELMQPIDPDLPARLITTLADRAAMVLDSAERVEQALGGLASGPHRNAMVAALRSETRLIGAIVLLDRPAVVGHFTTQHLRLLQTVAGHAAIALAKGRLEQQLRYRAFHDPLTNLANRALFLDRVEHALTRARRIEGSIAVLFVDIDDFKLVNDVHGHSAGDQLLAAFGERLRACLRPEDTAARFGGDEFVILLEEVRDVEHAIQVADRIGDAMRVPFVFAGFDVRVGVSVGIAPGGADSDAESLIVSADAAMYAAKQRGKGRYAVFESAMQASVLERYSLIADLRAALSRSEFVLRFQPILELSSRRVRAVETLVRWQHPQRGLLGPDSFIALAEETGLIADLDLWILEESCRNLAAWTSRGWGEGLGITVNISGHQLTRDDFARRVREALERTGLDPTRLVLEITEGVMVADLSSAARKLQPLRGIGIRLAIDDFGTGYSSLASLQHFPVDILKIAKPFVDDLGSGPQAETFLRAILSLGSALDLTVIAEGIETAKQAIHLEALGCHMGQGYHLSRPLAEPQLEELIRSQPAGRAGRRLPSAKDAALPV